ncbi:hypothetical protein F4778DRAFT_787165 [Xylariomycetidae sp. FL2044]|nr:hypothetical protein F4778DRAFT_787165 [Xylariomycetidae sp. FL2044]
MFWMNARRIGCTIKRTSEGGRDRDHLVHAHDVMTTATTIETVLASTEVTERMEEAHQKEKKKNTGDDHAFQYTMGDEIRYTTTTVVRKHRHTSSSRPQQLPEQLPFDARPLSRSRDFAKYRPLFARYLEVQKQKAMTSLGEREVRGRWKRFVGRWNRGELAEGWYRPEMLLEVLSEDYDRGEEGADATHRITDGCGSSSSSSSGEKEEDTQEESEEEDADEDDDDDEDYGPTPAQATTKKNKKRKGKKSKSESKPGPRPPNLQDLALRREAEREDRASQRADLRARRRADRAEQRERLEELAPRADPSSARERRLEKRAEVREKMRGFAADKGGGGGGGMVEVGDDMLMGGGGDGDGDDVELRRLKMGEQKREEVKRARGVEWAEKVRMLRERELRRMEELKGLVAAGLGGKLGGS